ncbi:PAS domain S-box protein [Sneathiella sp. P13V-1]|uniref:PAS domain S-box protein n=1 Tax=Sneathiella sp. P13V-1 TaxID=2697366 RepID=UPI00187B8A20|nr:PAS domain S-box protein [Sneathiella sp. P13V-1]MBE7637865.1 PAS domain S-box protein [Sneathiella sp. P13V-1]
MAVVLGIQNRKIKEASDIASLIRDFSHWATSWPRPVEEGARIVSKVIGTDQLCIDIKPVDDLPQTFHYCQIPEAPAIKGNEDEGFRDRILNDIINSGHNLDIRPVGSGYLLSTSINLQMPKGYFVLSAMFETEPHLTIEQSTFFQVAAPQLAHEISRDYRKVTAVELAEEAIEAIEESIIIYDKDDRVMIHNRQYRDLFPSIAKMLRQGVTYEELLREQAKHNPIYQKHGTLEEWISYRRKQLHTQGHQEEQSFKTGQTLRLTNYQLKSGGTISIRNNITELAEARKQAEENEKLFRTLLESAPVALAITAGERVLFANQILHDLVKAGEGELIGIHTREFFFDQEEHDTISQILIKNGKLRDHLIKIKDVDGNLIKASLTGTPIIYKNKPALFYAVLDVTENLANREALQKSEHQNRSILELIPDAITVQSKGKLVYTNPSFLEIFGTKDAQNILGTNSIDLIVEDHREAVLAHRNRVLETHQAAYMQTQHQRQNGERFHSELYTCAINWDGIPSTLNIIKDVSRRHQYEEQLKRNEQEMTLAQHIGNFGHWRHNLKDDTVVWSRTLYDLHGIDPATEITPGFFKDMISSEDFVQMNKAAEHAIETGEVTPYEIVVHHPDNSQITISGSLLAEYGNDGNVVSFFGVSEDVTERRELEQKFRQSQKMEAVGQLTGGVAHDFNNLLAIILGNSELLEENLNSDQKTEHAFINNIIRAATRGADLVNSMLAFSRTQELRPTYAYLKEPVTNIADVLKRTIEENVNISVSVAEDIWPCTVDVGQVENALLNLSLNARDAMPEGGSLSIDLSNVTLEAGEDTMGEEFKSGDYVKLCVCDSGTGIPQDKIQQVFDPFYTTKEVGKGTGLGLSMVYGFIKQSKGHVIIHSTMGLGTKVELYLPRSM